MKLLNLIKRNYTVAIITAVAAFIILKPIIEESFEQPDPHCLSGIRNGAACCTKECGTCGGGGCNGRPGGASNCCFGTIKSSERPCTEFGPPCFGVTDKPEESLDENLLVDSLVDATDGSEDILENNIQGEEDEDGSSNLMDKLKDNMMYAMGGGVLLLVVGALFLMKK